MFVMHFHNLTVVLREHGAGDFQKFENRINTHTHVGRKNDGNIFCGFGYLCLALNIKTCCTDHNAHIVFNAERKVCQSSLRTRKVNQHVSFGQFLNIVSDHHSGSFTERRTGVCSDLCNPWSGHSRNEFKVVTIEYGFNDEFAHAAGGTGNGYFHVRLLTDLQDEQAEWEENPFLCPESFRQPAFPSERDRLQFW